MRTILYVCAGKEVLGTSNLYNPIEELKITISSSSSLNSIVSVHTTNEMEMCIVTYAITINKKSKYDRLISQE